MIQGLVNLPNRMVVRRLTKRGYKLEAGLIILFGILGAAGYAYVWSRSMGALETEVEQLNFEFLGAALQPMVALLVLWVGYTVVPHLLSSVYNARGRIGRLFRGAAWALVPVGLWMTIRSIAMVVLFFDYDFPTEIPERFTAAGKYQFIFENGLQPDWVYTVVLLTGMLFAAWSGYLLSTAVAESKDISTADARKVAAVPAALAALYFLWTSLGYAGIL